jgi:hypothetical protein
MLERAKEATRYGKYTGIEYARFAADVVHACVRIAAARAKKGDRYLRSLLITGAMAVVRQAQIRPSARVDSRAQLRGACRHQCDPKLLREALRATRDAVMGQGILVIGGTTGALLKMAQELCEAWRV